MRLIAALLACAVVPVTVLAQPLPHAVGDLALETRLASTPSAAGALFGSAVSSSGTRALVGAAGENGNRGAAHVFAREGTAWMPEARLVAPVRAPNDAFGQSAALSGDRAVIGAPGTAAARGAAYVFARQGDTWVLEAQLVAADGQAPDQFGAAVALSGDRAVVGAPGAAGGSGAAYVFIREGGSWSFEARLSAPEGEANDGLGSAVALSGDRAVVGAPRALGRAGAAYVFAGQGATWGLDERLTASDAAPGAGFGDLFGFAVALSGDDVLVGAYGRNSFRGAAYVFTRAAEGWVEQAQLTPAGVMTSDFFGDAVAIEGARAIVGASGTLAARGAVYLFEREGGAWVERTRLSMPGGAILDVFGIAVGLDGGRAFVSARGEGDRRGAVYVYASASVGAESAPPSGFLLTAPWPNPTTAHATLTLRVERPQHVRAVVLDALGRTVAVLFDGVVAGEAQLSVAAEALPPGAYAVRVRGEGFSQTRRLTVVR